MVPGAGSVVTEKRKITGLWKYPSSHKRGSRNETNLEVGVKMKSICWVTSVCQALELLRP